MNHDFHTMDAHEAIRVLYEDHSNDVFRYARLSVNHQSEAYDIVQEVFLKAFGSWHTYRQDANPKTWLIRIARNYIYDLYRKKRRNKEWLESLTLMEQDESELLDRLIDIREALSELKLPYKEVIILRHVEDYSIKETAEILGWSESKVRSTTHRALMKLRAILGENDEEVTQHHEVRARRFK